MFYFHNLLLFNTNIPKPFRILLYSIYNGFYGLLRRLFTISTDFSVCFFYSQRSYTTVFTVCWLFLRTSPSLLNTYYSLYNGCIGLLRWPKQRHYCKTVSRIPLYSTHDGFHGLPCQFQNRRYSQTVSTHDGFLCYLRNGLHRHFPYFYGPLRFVLEGSRKFYHFLLIATIFTHVVFLLLFKILFSARISYFFALIFLHTSSTLLALVFTHFLALKSSSFTAKIFFYYSQFYPLLALKSSSFSR